MGPNLANVPHFGKTFSRKSTKNPKNVKKCQTWDENIKDARRNSEHFRRIQTFWGPLFDHFPDFNDFVKIGPNGPIPQTVQIWPSGRASGLESLPARAQGSNPPPANLGVSGWAQSFFRGKNKPVLRLVKGS